MSEDFRRLVTETIGEASVAWVGGAIPVGVFDAKKAIELADKICDAAAQVPLPGADGSVAAAFNRWLDDYENNPEKFEHEWAMIRKHLKEKADGVEPTYGEGCVATLKKYIEEIRLEIEEPVEDAAG